MFVILQKYDFSSKSQLYSAGDKFSLRCLWYCKSTIFQANHNADRNGTTARADVCDTAKVRFFKQITTSRSWCWCRQTMFVILQKYDFSSKSQLVAMPNLLLRDVCDTAKVRFFKQITTATALQQQVAGCLWYCKSTIFQANHNEFTDKILHYTMFVILQKYDFSSKSQQKSIYRCIFPRCLWYCKSTIFQANHNHRGINSLS